MRRKASVGIALLAAGLIPSAAHAAFVENFDYPDGQLGGQGAWVGNPDDATTAGRLDVVSNHLQLTHNDTVPSANVSATTSFAPVGPDGSGVITVITHAELGSGDGGNIWFFRAKDAGGNVLGAWDGQFTTARPRIANSVLAAQALTGTGYDELRMDLNVVTGAIDYYFNGASVGSLDSTTVPGAFNIIGSMVSQIEFQRQGRGGTGTFTGSLNFDSVSVVPEPATLGLLALGALCLRGRRRPTA